MLAKFNLKMLFGIQDVGLLNVLPSKIHAKDGDVKIDEDIIYTIKDSGKYFSTEKYYQYPMFI